MANYYTWAEIYAHLKTGELDLEAAGDEDLADEEELKKYANEAIDEAEALIHSLYEDYFLTRTFLSPEPEVEEIPLPANIYAMKIRGINHLVGDNVEYEVRRIRDMHKFLHYRIRAGENAGALPYEYFLINEAPGAPKILMCPPPPTSGTLFECWYIRNANRLVESDDICDIPEFIEFVYAHAKMKIYLKEQSPMYGEAKEHKERTKQLMLETLTGMVPDNGNEIEADLSAYEEMS